MKKQFLISSLLVFLFAAFFSGCSKDPINADEAQQSVRDGKDEMMQNMDEMLEFDGMEAIVFMMELMDMDLDLGLKTSLKSSKNKDDVPFVYPWLNFVKKFANLKGEKTDPSPSQGGIWQYNYSTQQFDLIDTDVDYLRFILPANQADYDSQGLNGEITLTNYQFVVIDGDEYPTNFTLTIKAFGNIICIVQYQGAFDADGMPTMFSLSLSMDPYSLSLSLSTTSNKYTIAASFKKNNNVLLGVDLAIDMLDNMMGIKKVSGYLQLTPLKFEGEINVEGLDACLEDNIGCINNNLDIKLYNLSPKKRLLGSIEARTFQDGQESFIAPALVYKDGTYEGLHEIFYEFEDLFDEWKK